MPHASRLASSGAAVLEPGADRPSPLIAYAMRGLRNCWMPRLGRWSHIYHLDGRSDPNESVPESDVFYTLNVLLGLSRVEQDPAVHGFDLPEIFRANVALVPTMKSPKYAYGMALWASAALGVEIPLETRQAIATVVEDPEGWQRFRAQDLGIILIGCVEQARLDPRRWGPTSRNLFKLLDNRYSCASGLFYDAASGARRRFSSFATHTYLTLACYSFGEWSGDTRALALANTCARRLIALQGPHGEWPWFFYTPAARIADWYEVYSVHQAGMAPAFLECAERHGVPGATAALVNGFRWILGHNQLNRSMLRPDLGLICRSQIRKGERDDKRKRVARAIAAAVTGRAARLADPDRVTVRLECRSYELGWMLWSFGRRSDLRELRFHADLSTASLAQAEACADNTDPR